MTSADGKFWRKERADNEFGQRIRREFRKARILAPVRGIWEGAAKFILQRSEWEFSIIEYAAVGYFRFPRILR
jgi:hypothetical protein